MHRLYGAYAAVSFVLLSVLTTGLLCVTPGLHNRRRLGRVALRVAFWCIGVRFTVSGHEHVPAGPCMAVCNHASLLDGMILTTALPTRFTFPVHMGARRMPVFGLLIRRMGVCFVRNEVPHLAAVDVRGLIRRARAGESFAVFPEGNIGSQPGLRAFRDGAAFIAVHSGLQVLPCVIHGSRALFGRGNGGPKRQPIHVEILPPMAVRRGDRALAIPLTAEAKAAIQSALEQAGPGDARGRGGG